MSVAPIAITGMGCICAAGRNLPGAMESLLRGERHPAPPVRFASRDPVDFPVFQAGGLRGTPGSPPDQRLRSARGPGSGRRRGLTGTYWGASRVELARGRLVGTVMSEETFCRGYLAGHVPDMTPIRRILRSNPADVIAREFGLSVPARPVTACASGTDAVGSPARGSGQASATPRSRAGPTNWEESPTSDSSPS